MNNLKITLEYSNIKFFFKNPDFYAKLNIITS